MRIFQKKHAKSAVLLGLALVEMTIVLVLFSFDARQHFPQGAQAATFDSSIIPNATFSHKLGSFQAQWQSLNGFLYFVGTVSEPTLAVNEVDIDQPTTPDPSLYYAVDINGDLNVRGDLQVGGANIDRLQLYPQTNDLITCDAVHYGQISLITGGQQGYDVLYICAIAKRDVAGNPVAGAACDNESSGRDNGYCWREFCQKKPGNQAQCL